MKFLSSASFGTFAYIAFGNEFWCAAFTLLFPGFVPTLLTNSLFILNVVVGF